MHDKFAARFSSSRAARRSVGVACSVCALIWTLSGFAQVLSVPSGDEAFHVDEPTPPSPASRYRIWVVTFGPGDHPFTRFGHNALWVEDAREPPGEVYNFGTFQGGPDLVSDFLKGRLFYWLSVADLRSTLLVYEAQNRSARAQRLGLSRSQTETLVRKLQENALPQNRVYKYDYYSDNCSTRIRDVLDEATRGALFAVSRHPEGLSWREHTLRLTQDDFLLKMGLDLVLGPAVDKPRTVWEEMFLPSVLQTTLRRATQSVAAMPLVVEERELLSARRLPPEERPSSQWSSGILSWLVCGLSLVLLESLGVARKRGRALLLARGALYLVGAGWGALAGCLGCALVLLWIVTDHQVVDANINVLLFPPWALALLPLGPLAIRVDAARRMFLLCSIASFVTTLGAGALFALSWTRQDISGPLAWAAPIWATLCVSSWRFNRATAR